MIKNLIAVTATLAVLMAGCASTGVHVDEAKVTQFRDVKTTYGDVVGSLGQPTSSMVASTGNRTIMYVYAHAQVRAATFVPVVGMFAGGMDTTSTSASFTFDRDGVLILHSSTNSQYGTGSGVLSGAATNLTV
jgi:hypothetical protein